MTPTVIGGGTGGSHGPSPPLLFLGGPSPNFCLDTVSLGNTVRIGSSDKVNRSMKKMLQNFVDIISYILFVIWQISQLFGRIHRTVCHLAMDCLPHRCCWTVLPDGVIQHNFLQKWCNFTCLYAWALEGIFPGGATSGFFQKYFYGGPKMVKFVFYHSKLRKQHFLLKFSNFCPSSDIYMLVCRKSCAKQLKNIGNLKRFNTIPNNEILLNLIHKWNIWQVKFNCVFALATLNSYILFLHWQHNWHSYGQLAVATYALSGLCILVHRWRNRLAAWT